MSDPTGSVDSAGQTIPATEDQTAILSADTGEILSSGGETVPPFNPAVDLETVRRIFDRIRANPNFNALWNPDAGSFPMTYAQSIIRSDDYSGVADHRPVELAIYPKADSKRFPDNAVVVYPGFNRVTGNDSALVTELLPLGKRPFVPFSVDLGSPWFEVDATDPLYPMVEAASRESDLLDALAAMVRWIKEHVEYSLNDEGRTPEQILADRWGDCDDMSAILKQGCDLLGVECDTAGGAMYDANYDGISGWTCHAWNMIKAGDAWIPVDVTLAAKGGPADGNQLWEMASKTFWVPLSDKVMEQWRQIEAIKPTENMAYIDFDTASFEWNGIADLAEKMQMSPADLRAYLVSQGSAYLVEKFEGEMAYEEQIPDIVALKNYPQYQKIYLDIVTAQWLSKPDIIVDPLAGLDRLQSLLQSQTWSEEIKKSYGFLALVLLTFALADAEGQRLEFGALAPIEPIRPDELYKSYQEWKPFLPKPTGYAGLIDNEWEKRLRALYEWDGQPTPEDLTSSRPEYGHFLEVLKFVQEEKTPEELRQRTIDYTASRKKGIPDLTEDAKLLENWVADGELQWVGEDDLKLLRGLFEAMKQYQAGDQNAGEGAFEVFKFKYGFPSREGMSILGQVYLRDIYSRELDRRLEALANHPEKSALLLDEALQIAEVLSQSQLNQRVITEARPLADVPQPDKSRAPEDPAFRYLARSIPMKKMMGLLISPEEAKARINNNTSIQESRLVSLDEASLGRCREALAELGLIAGRLAEIAGQLSAGSAEKAWCDAWLVRYQRVRNA